MAADKKSFLMYCDMIHSFETLTDDEAGKLVKHLFRYVNDMNPEAPDRFTEKMFEPIKHKLKEALVRWEETKKKRAEAGSKGGQITVANRNKNKQDEANQANASILQANQAVTDTVTVINDKSLTISKEVGAEVISAGVFEPNGTPEQIEVNGPRNETLIHKTLLGTPIYYPTIKYSDAEKECLMDENWKLDVERLHKIPVAKVHLALSEFLLHCSVSGEKEKRNVKEFKSHFSNWVRIKKSKAQPTKTDRL